MSAHTNEKSRVARPRYESLQQQGCSTTLGCPTPSNGCAASTLGSCSCAIGPRSAFDQLQFDAYVLGQPSPLFGDRSALVCQSYNQGPGGQYIPCRQ